MATNIIPIGQCPAEESMRLLEQKTGGFKED